MKIQNIILVSLVVIGMVSAWQSTDYPGDGSQTVYNVSAGPGPFEVKSPGMYTKIIVIGGIPFANPYKWEINLIMSNTGYTAFHFDVRFNVTGSANTIVRNTRTDTWANEETTTPSFPFKPDQYFEVRIVVEPDRFKVAVNNIHLLDFAKRLEKMSDIDTLRVGGDVRLTYVHFQ